MKKSKWIVNARWDLTFFIGSVSVCFLYYALYKLCLFLPETSFFHRYAEFIALLIFYSLFDHPHIFQSFSRTHGDPLEFSRRRGLYTYGLSLLILSGFLIKILHWEVPFEAFLNLYGIWHILRQNSGFLKLYKRKAGEDSLYDKLLDFGMLYGSLGIFLFYRLVDTSRKPLEWIPNWGLSFPYFDQIFGSMMILYGLRQLYLFQQGKVHLPKLLFLSAIIGTSYFVYVLSDPPLGILVALETIYHDIQYQGWIIHFQKRRFAKGIWKKWLRNSLLYGVIFGTLTISVMWTSLSQWMLTPFLMLVAFHYFIDGKIWRTSEAKELKVLF